MKLTKMQKQIVENGVQNLKEFGYPNVDKKNIFTDSIYNPFFVHMLKESANVTKNNSLMADFAYLLELCDEHLIEN